MTAGTTTNPRAAGIEPLAPSVSDDRISVLEVFASQLVPVGLNMSNQSTSPQETDFDDQ